MGSKIFLLGILFVQPLEAYKGLAVRGGQGTRGTLAIILAHKPGHPTYILEHHQSSSTLLGLHPLFCMQSKAVVCSAIPPILTLVAGMSLAHGKSIWPSWDVYPGGPMHYSAGTLGPSTLRCGLGQVKVVLEDGLGEL